VTGRRNLATDVFKKIDMKGGDSSACWPYKGGHSDKGIPYFDYGGRKYVAYRLVFELFHGPLAKGEVPRHTCDNGAPNYLAGLVPGVCCNPHHLVRGTHADNMRDMKERERHGLPHHTIRAIKKLIGQGRQHALIADLYGVSRETVTAIANGRSYSHVEMNEDEEGNAS
jgi:hypothetical protein